MQFGESPLFPAWAPNEATIAAMEGGQLVARTVLGESQPVTFEKSESVIQAAYSPDGKLVAGSTEDGEVRFWSATTGALARPAVTLFPGRPHWSANADRIVVVGHSAFQVFDIISGTAQDVVKLSRELSGPHGILAATLSGDGRTLSWSSGEKFVTWNIAEGKPSRVSQLPFEGDLTQADDLIVGWPGWFVKGLWDAKSSIVGGRVLLLAGGEVVIDPRGHLRATDIARGKLVYVAKTKAAQEVMSYDAFAKRFAFKNQADQVKLMRP
jgi:hypothetical protein